MTTRRQRVLDALDFKPTDRIPKDLGGMASTGISCFAYPRLVEALGLPPRRPRVHDTSQMLALPDTDVLDALDCDVVTAFWGVTNAFEEPRKWKRYDFGGRLDARVRNPRAFELLPDGTIVQPLWQVKMSPNAVVFNGEHAGQSMDIMDADELPLKDLKKLRKELRRNIPKKAEIAKIRDLCQRVRESTDRAVFFNGPCSIEIAISAHGGMAVFPVICLLEPDYAAEYHEIMTEYSLEKLNLLLPEIAPFIDVLLLGGDDWGTQQATIASPRCSITCSSPSTAAPTTRPIASPRRSKPSFTAAAPSTISWMMSSPRDSTSSTPCSGRQAGTRTASGKTRRAAASPCGAAASTRSTPFPTEAWPTSSARWARSARAFARTAGSSSTPFTTCSPKSIHKKSSRCTAPRLATEPYANHHPPPPRHQFKGRRTTPMPHHTLTVERINGGAPVLQADPTGWDNWFTLNPSAVYLDRSPRNDALVRGLLQRDPATDALLGQGVVVVVYRGVEKDAGDRPLPKSAVGLAVFTPAFELLKRFATPIVSPDPDPAVFDHDSVEDQRLVRIGDTFYLVYAGVRAPAGEPMEVRVCLAKSDDLIHWTKPGPVQGNVNDAPNKDAVLFPEPFNGRWYMLHRPCVGKQSEFTVALAESDSPEGVWRNLGPIMDPWRAPRYAESWIGAGSAPIPLGGGRYLFDYHTGNYLANGERDYFANFGLIDLNNLAAGGPRAIVISRIEEVVYPATRFERNSPWPHEHPLHCVFPCGSFDHDGHIHLVYGAADAYVCAVRVPKDQLLAALRAAETV